MKKRLFLLAFVIIFGGCKKPYTPKAISNPPNYLVVEGTILSGTDSTIFKLSRTVKLSSDSTTNPVTGAELFVETATTNYGLSEVKPGYYALPPLNFDPTQQYRLKIVLADNSTYVSDFVPLQTTPPIDSIGYSIINNGVQLYVNTHDPFNKTRYYRWEYQETWRFHAEYYTSFITDGTQLLVRQPDQQIYYCFANDASGSILLGSSAKLSRDVIYETPIAFIPSTSEKVELRYSILLKQYPLTKEAFTFWTNLKTITEQLGSIFDAQPTQLNGNIHNVDNPAEHVFGFISANTVQTKRIFIDRTQLPASWKAVYPYQCELDTLWYMEPRSNADQVARFLIPLPPTELAIGAFGQRTTQGYLSADHACADCTIRGTTQQPGFWQ